MLLTALRGRRTPIRQAPLQLLWPASTWIPPPAVTAACDWFDYRSVPYPEAWKWQQDLLSRRIARDAPVLPDVVLCLEHPHVYTLGRAASEADLLFTATGASVGAEVHRVERGGKVTYHGPGQLVVYPVLQLERYVKDLHWYVTGIEETIIRTLSAFGLEGHRHAGYPGVWLGDRKIAQIGMNCSKWVTSHGFALNVSPDMTFFEHIVPCGIDDKAVTSMAAELGRPVHTDEVRSVVARVFSDVFNVSVTRRVGEGPPLFCEPT